jgi:peptidoglycan/LPS O-acetylase OafA/YrhL
VGQRRVSLAIALALLVLVFVTKESLQQAGSLGAFILMMAVAGILIWSVLLAVLGYGFRYLARGNRLLAYANEAVLPFYILHQPVILIIGYFVLPLPLPILAQYLLIASTAFGVTIGLYEFGIRRVNPARRIFGLKPLAFPVRVVTTAPAG